uniref:Ciliary neurotrophic factor n=1 Tax=Astyanax mexicanus TaxID=7994 RepID=A0A3B1KEC3_ASTMX
MEEHTGSDAPSSGRSDTRRAADLALLLQQECRQLLELYKERESFLCQHVPEGGRLVIPAVCEEVITSADQVGHVRSALRGCLELLECLILQEVEQMGQELEGEYETVRKTVKDRLGHLLHSTGALLENGEGVCPPSPDYQCNQDEVEGPGSFANKMWTYRVLLELIHWTDSAAQALHLLHSEREAEQQQQEL